MEGAALYETGDLMHLGEFTTQAKSFARALTRSVSMQAVTPWQEARTQVQAYYEAGIILDSWDIAVYLEKEAYQANAGQNGLSIQQNDQLMQQGPFMDFHPGHNSFLAPMQ